MYPGSFNPPTVAHLAIAQAAIDQRNLETLTFAISKRALAKEDVDQADRPRFVDRIAVMEQMVAGNDRFELLVTDQQLIVDIAASFDVVVLGADKWVQIQDPVFYGDDVTVRDRALDALPELALVPRPPFPTDGAPTLDLHADVAAMIETVSSTLAREGDRSLMVPAARAFDEDTGAWTDPDRYERLLNPERRP